MKKTSFASFQDAIAFSANQTQVDITKKYKGEKRKKAELALDYAKEYFASHPIGWNINDSQDTVKEDCEEYVKRRFQSTPVGYTPEGEPAGFFIIGAILAAIIGWVIRKLLDMYWDHVKI